jgi:hypothetical protein
MTTIEMVRALKAAQTRTIAHRFMCEGIRKACSDAGAGEVLDSELADCIVTADDHVSALDHAIVLLMAEEGD